MKTTKYFFVPLMIFLLVSCNGKKINAGDRIGENDNKLFVAFPDSKKIQSDWSKENTVVCHWISDPNYLHPANYTTHNAQTVISLTHSFILVSDQMNTGMVPVLVKSMPAVSADHLQFTYELLDEATWDDGSPITSDDVIFTFKAAVCPLTDNPLQKSSLANLKTINGDPSDPKRFTVLMSRPYVQSLEMMSNLPILSEKYFDPGKALGTYSFEQLMDPALKADAETALKNWATVFNDSKYGNDPDFFYGSGPYKVVNWERGQTITLQRKANHWTSHLKKDNTYLHSYPEKIIFKSVKDENAVMLECKSQTIDASTWLSTKSLLSLQADSSFNSNYNSAFVQSYSMNYIAFNMRPDGINHKKIFDDVKVRHAIALVVPVDNIIRVIGFGKANRWPSMVSPLKAEYNADLKPLPYDVEAASKLLDEAGWKDTDGDNIRDKVIDGEKVNFEVNLTFTAQGNNVKDIVAMISEAAYRAGIKIDPRPVEAGVLTENAHNHDFDMIFSAFTTPSMPEDYSQIWSTSSWSSKGFNFSGFGNAETDALIDSINGMLDETGRISLVKRLQKIVYDQQPYVFLYSGYRKIIVHKRFGNAVITTELPGLILNDLKLISGSSLAMITDIQ